MTKKATPEQIKRKLTPRRISGINFKTRTNTKKSRGTKNGTDY